MTRHLLDIGDRNRQREEGFGLITRERDRHDLRRHHARITPEGKALMHKIITALKTACETIETIRDPAPANLCAADRANAPKAPGMIAGRPQLSHAT
jgi:hypothetical protein